MIRSTGRNALASVTASPHPVGGDGLAGEYEGPQTRRNDDHPPLRVALSQVFHGFTPTPAGSGGTHFCLEPLGRLSESRRRYESAGGATSLGTGGAARVRERDGAGRSIPPDDPSGEGER